MRSEHPSTGIDLEILAMVPGLDTAETSPALAFGAQLGGTPSTDKVTYGTEAGLFQAAGIETVVCGPGDIQQAHAPDEFIEVDQILACEALVDRLRPHPPRPPPHRPPPSRARTEPPREPLPPRHARRQHRGAVADPPGGGRLFRRQRPRVVRHH